MTDTKDLVNRLERIERNQAEIVSFISVFKGKLIESQVGFYQPHSSTPQSDQQSIDKQQRVWGNVQLIRSAIAANDYQMISSLAAEWDKDFKESVYEQLQQSEKDYVKKMKAAYDQYLKPAYEAYQKALSDNAAGISSSAPPFIQKAVSESTSNSDDDDWSVSTRSESEAKDNLGGADELVARQSVNTWKPSWNAKAV